MDKYIKRWIWELLWDIDMDDYIKQRRQWGVKKLQIYVPKKKKDVSKKNVQR